MAHMTEEEREEILKTINAFKTQAGRKELFTAGPDTISIRDFLYILSTIRPVVNVDRNGAIGTPFLKDATMGDAIKSYPMYSTGQSLGLGTLQTWQGNLRPENVVGPAVFNPNAGAGPDEWKHGFFSLNPGADQAIIAAVTGKKIDLWFTYSNIIRANAGSGNDPNEVIIELEDEDNVDLSGIDEIHYMSFFVTAISTAGAWDAGLYSHHAYSATAAKAIEASITAVNAGDIVNGGYAYREF